jgi:hypothetical protein
VGIEFRGAIPGPSPVSSRAPRRHHQSPGRMPGIKKLGNLDLSPQGNPQDAIGRNRFKGKDTEAAQQMRGD